MRAWMVSLIMLAGCDPKALDDLDGGDDTGEDTSDPTDTDTDTDTDTSADALAGCLGFHAGTYSGADYGLAEGVLKEDGLLLITFTSSGGGGGVEGVITIAADGSLSGASQGIEVSGTYDAAQCTASGDWGPEGGSSAGSWQMWLE